MRTDPCVICGVCSHTRVRWSGMVVIVKWVRKCLIRDCEHTRRRQLMHKSCQNLYLSHHAVNVVDKWYLFHKCFILHPREIKELFVLHVSISAKEISTDAFEFNYLAKKLKEPCCKTTDIQRQKMFILQRTRKTKLTFFERVAINWKHIISPSDFIRVQF